MMGASNLPPAELVRDLRAMLDLMQLAADPKKAKTILDKIDDAHAEIAGKLAEIEAREKAVVALEEKADKAVAKAEAATNTAITEQANAANMKAALRQDEESLAAVKAALNAQAVAQAQRAAELDQREAAMQAQHDRAMDEVASKAKALDIRLSDVEKIKADLQTQQADLNERLQKLRAIAE